jgi:hypothetical protein
LEARAAASPILRKSHLARNPWFFPGDDSSKRPRLSLGDGPCGLTQGRYFLQTHQSTGARSLVTQLWSPSGRISGRGVPLRHTGGRSRGLQVAHGMLDREDAYRPIVANERLPLGTWRRGDETRCRRRPGGQAARRTKWYFLHGLQPSPRHPERPRTRPAQIAHKRSISRSSGTLWRSGSNSPVRRDWTAAAPRERLKRCQIQANGLVRWRNPFTVDVDALRHCEQLNLSKPRARMLPGNRCRTIRQLSRAVVSCGYAAWKRLTGPLPRPVNNPLSSSVRRPCPLTASSAGYI